jgi:hypothetical protein
MIKIEKKITNKLFFHSVMIVQIYHKMKNRNLFGGAFFNGIVTTVHKGFKILTAVARLDFFIYL